MRVWIAPLSILVSLCFVFQATAQIAEYPVADEPATGVAEAPTPAARRESRSRFIEEIIVTSQKREENLQDIPISVQAFSAQLLDARGITDQKELQLITPGLDIGTQVSYTTVFLRGIGTDAFLTADPSVATYIDGIYFPFAQGLAQEFGAVQRIEVLKGPQGTLFGRNANGGAISIVTEKPSFTDRRVSVQASVANYPDLQTRVHTNIPVSDTFAFSVSALYNKSEYFVSGLADGKPLPDDISRGARIRLRWQPIEDLDITLSAFKLLVQGAGSNFTLNRNPTPLGRALLMQDQEPFYGELDAATFNNLDNTVYYGEAQYNAGPFDIKILGSTQYIDTNGIYDFDGSVIPVASFLPTKNFADVQTAELQFLSNDQSWGSEWFKWIIGGFYFKGLSGFDPIIGTIGGIDLSGFSSSVGGLPPGFVDQLDPLLTALGVGRVIPSGQLFLEATLLTESQAAFVQATFSITDWLDLTLGGRYQSEKRTIDKSSTSLRAITGEEIDAITYDFALDQNNKVVGPTDTTNRFTPKVSVDLRPFDDGTLIYLSYQKAVKSSTYNTTAITKPPSYVSPETLTAYELGIKKSLFDGLMNISAAAFHYDIDDLQVQFFALLNGGVVSFENAKGARSQGIDFDTTVQLFPDLVDDLVLAGGAAYIDAKYTSFENASGYDEVTGLFGTRRDFTGNRIVRSPKYSGSISLSKTWQISGGPLEVVGDFYHNDGFFYEASNITRSEQRAYSVFGTRVSYLYEPWNVRTTIFCKNLGDKAYTQGALPNDFGDGLNFAPPRTYGMRLNWDF